MTFKFGPPVIDGDTVSIPLTFEVEMRDPPVDHVLSVRFVGKRDDCKSHTPGRPHAPCWTFTRASSP